MMRPPTWWPGLRRLLSLRRPDGAAETRMVRVVAFAFLPAAAVFGFLAIGPIASQWRYFPPLWSIVVLVGVVGSALALGAVAFTASLVVLRLLGATSALSALAAQATESLVVLDWPDPEQPPWVQQLLALGAIAGAVAWSIPASILLALALAVLTAIDRVALDGADALLVGVQDGLYVLLFAITFIALGVRLFAGARRADAAHREAS